VKSRNSPLRTVDIARGAGYSVQQVRDLERAGVLPPAGRTETGYRTYTEAHLHAALAYRALAKALGPVAARDLMRIRDTPDLLARLDAAHARLHAEREELRLAEEAASLIASEPVEDARPSDSMTISELAEALGVRTSTLRHWDAEGLVTPARERNARTYSPKAVRDARIVHQLRLAGYRIDLLRTLMPRLSQHRLRDALAARDADITARSRALLDAAAALAAVIQPR